MVLLKRLNPFAKSVTSIAKTADTSQTSPTHQPQPITNPFFLPTFNDQQSLKLWASFIAFFSLICIVLELSVTTNVEVLSRYIVKTVVITTMIVSGEMWFIANSVKRFKDFSWRSKKITNYLLGTVFIIVPMLSLFARLLLFLLVGYELSVTELMVEIISNTLLAFFMMVILLTYFNMLYRDVKRAELNSQQKLIEQNEQLKARITPHFFFNMLNTMQYLIETDPYEAEMMIRHISNLYRVSFDETREIALLDEIALCESYLSIEKYRFDKKLNVTWQLPDEELLYDMVITSLSLQMVIEKLIVLIVENTTEAIALLIAIDWQDDWVKVDISIELPIASHQILRQDIHQTLSFNSQIAILRQFYGEMATIDYQLTAPLLITQIRYPLKDVAVF